jgi:hypothetical protein
VTLPGSGGTVSFKYDPFARRIYKSSSSGTSIFAYDGDNLVEETNSSGTAVAHYEDTQNWRMRHPTCLGAIYAPPADGAAALSFLA